MKKKIVLALIVLTFVLAACTSTMTIKNANCTGGDPEKPTDCTTSVIDVTSTGSVF